MMLPASTTRVPRHTAAHINEQIRRDTEQSIARCAAAGRTAIDQRLAELEHEWDIERTLKANAATVGLIGLTLGATVDRRWFLLPTAVAAFLLQHTLQGWCPPLPVFRRLGIRTPREIDAERDALKVLRGDFRDLPPVPDGAARVDAARLLSVDAARLLSVMQ